MAPVGSGDFDFRHGDHDGCAELSRCGVPLGTSGLRFPRGRCRYVLLPLNPRWARRLSTLIAQRTESPHSWRKRASVRAFLEQDPIPGELSAPLTLARYVYAQNAPYCYNDPTGEFSLSLSGFLSGGLGLGGFLSFGVAVAHDDSKAFFQGWEFGLTFSFGGPRSGFRFLRRFYGHVPVWALRFL